MMFTSVTNIAWRTASGSRLGGFAYRYDALGRIVSRAHDLGGASFDRDYAYDGMDRLAADGGVAYAYDAAGKRVSKNDERYTYNVRGELILATNIVTGSEFAYQYDDIGNRLWSREFGTNCTYVANELNQYTNIVRGGVFELSAFDFDGNQTNVVTSTGEWAVEYNGENRPVRWYRTFDGATIRMAYDRKGRRVEMNDETFVYDNYLNIGKTTWDPTELVATRPLVWFNDEGARCSDCSDVLIDIWYNTGVLGS